MLVLASLFAILPLAPRFQGAPPSDDAIRLGSPMELPEGTSREGMWPAPTAEDWSMPVLVPWERTFEDALRVAELTKKPILVCVNMDGEIASEHFAGIRYRRTETAALYEPYVCVIASVYRHNARDYDQQGRRVPCPRFGTVTCGEHIAIEPLLFEEFFDGKRIAPRHIAVELDGKETYDVYYSWDTKTVSAALTYGVADREPPRPLANDDLPVVERVASPHVADRVAVEVAYQQGSREVRRSLIDAVMTHRDVDQIDLLRMAIFGFDLELARLARQALVQCDSESAVDLIAEALKVPMDQAEREALIEAAVRLAEKYPRARTLVAVHRGLASGSERIDVEAWSRPMSETGATAYEAQDPASEMDARSRAAAEHPDDAEAHLALAEAFHERGAEPGIERRFARVLLEDAQRSALRARELGATGWRLNGLLAVVSAALGERGAAREHAAAAIESRMPAPDPAFSSTRHRDALTVLALYAEARQRAIAAAYRERKIWPAEWLADVHAAYAVIARHPLGTDEHVSSHYDFLRWLGATPRATEVLEQGLARFPESWILHDRLRAAVLWEKGPDGLESTYQEMLARPDASPNLDWFAGYASLVAAEHHRRSGGSAEALAAYERGIAHYQRGIEKNPDSRASADHYVALALAGRARIELEQGELERATDDILACFDRMPDAAATPDGLNVSPVDTANMLRSRLDEAGRDELAARVRAGLAALDPRLLELPAYEREGAPRVEGRRRERQ